MNLKIPIKILLKKNLEIIDNVESNYRVITRVYQHLYSDIADISFEYIHSLELDEIQELDDDIKTNGWGLRNPWHRQRTGIIINFSVIYYNTVKFPLLNELLVIPDSDVPDEEEKINIKIFKKCFNILNPMYLCLYSF